MVLQAGPMLIHDKLRNDEKPSLVDEVGFSAMVRWAGSDTSKLAVKAEAIWPNTNPVCAHDFS